jgi:hypothetical protein
MEKCPYCYEGSISGHRDYRDGKRRSENFKMTCPVCNGSQEVTAEVAAPKKRGNAIREDRIARGLGMRQEAERLGISPSRLSVLENGTQNARFWELYDSAVNRVATHMTEEEYAERMHQQGKEKGWTPEATQAFIDSVLAKSRARQKEEFDDFMAGSHGSSLPTGSLPGGTKASSGHDDFLYQQSLYNGHAD